MKTNLLVCLFGATTFLLASNTFACEGARSCGTSCLTVFHVTSCPPVSHITSCPPVGYGTPIIDGMPCCISPNGSTGGAYEIERGYELDGGHQNDGGSSSQLDPDVLTRQNGNQLKLASTPQGQRQVNTERIWTDSSGEHKRLATFVRIEGTTVILMNEKGGTTRIELLKLSTADQRLVDQLRKESISEPLPSDQERLISSRP